MSLEVNSIRIHFQKLNFNKFKEAKQILNLSKIDNTKEIEESFKRLFELNDKTKGGSFYLQSKVNYELKDLKKKIFFFYLDIPSERKN